MNEYFLFGIQAIQNIRRKLLGKEIIFENRFFPLSIKEIDSAEHK